MMLKGKEVTLSASEEEIFHVYTGTDKRFHLTREQLDEFISQNAITESRLKVNPGHYGEWITMQTETYIEQHKICKSQYGERVILQPVDVNETVSGEAVSIVRYKTKRKLRNFIQRSVD